MNAPDPSLDVIVAEKRETMGVGTENGHAPTRAADWLSLAAAPTFAIMALLTGVLGGGAPDMLCSAAQGGSPLDGMAPMYVLMSAFHSAPWLRLFCSRTGAMRGHAPGVNSPAR